MSDHPERPGIIRRSEGTPRIVCTAAEDIKAGASVVLDLTTGLVHIHHQETP